MLSGSPSAPNHETVFVEGSFDFIPVDRLNYQSYGGYSAKPIQEFLFVARKSKPAEVENDLGGNQWIGQASVLGTA